MGACGSRQDKPRTYAPTSDSSEDKLPRKTMTPEEIRKSHAARDSFRFNNRKGKTNTDDPSESPPRKMAHQRDSMLYNNKTGSQGKTLQLALVKPEEFVTGCRDALRSKVLAQKIRDIVKGGKVAFEDVDRACIWMIPRDAMYKFYSQESLRQALFTTCGGPSDVDADSEYEQLSVPVAKVLPLLRNMFFIKRMTLCFQDEDMTAGGMERDVFQLACTQPESLYQNGDAGDLYDRVVEEKGKADWRHLVAAIADSFINSVALPKFS